MADRSIPLSTLKDITSVVMHAAAADRVEIALQRIAHATRQLVKAKYAALGIPDGNGGLTHFKVSGVSSEAISKMNHPPVGKGLIGAIMTEDRPIRLEQIHDDPRSSGFPEGHPKMDRFLGMPIQVGEQLFGMVYLADREDGQPFTLADQWLVETMAGYAALAIAGVQLRERDQRLTLLEERQRIGMELHDGIIQSLYALGMHIDLIRTSIDSPPDTFKPVIDGLNTIIEEIREYIMNLHRRDIAIKRSASDVIKEVVGHLYIPNDLKVVVNASENPLPFNENDTESVCMIVREALSNIVRHAGACTATITVWNYPEQIKIVISDDGKGFDKAKLDKDDGLGLRNMQQRARLHNGDVEIDSAMGQGTTVTLNIPIN